MISNIVKNITLKEFIDSLGPDDRYKFLVSDSHNNLIIDPPADYYYDVVISGKFNAKLCRYDIEANVPEFRNSAVIIDIKRNNDSMITLDQFFKISPMIDRYYNVSILLQSESDEKIYEEVKYSESFDSYEVVKWNINPSLGYFIIYIK